MTRIKNAPHFMLENSCALCDITQVARGPSGRIVVETDPQLKRDLHAALAAEGTTLKEWLESHAKRFLSERIQPNLPGLNSMGNSEGNKRDSR